METDSNFGAARGNGGGSARRFDSAFDIFLDDTSFAHLQEALQDLPDARPGAVARARKLIADPNYPSPQIQEILAQRLAVQLTIQIDTLPT
jgi:hypothetical protein